MTPIRKAVFPVAGLGTRFLPATKAMPKEMLPVVDRPLIQHVVDEAREAGIEHFIFVTGRNKGVIEDHFDRQFELEHTLTERKRNDDLEALSRDLPGPGTTSFTRQQLPLGVPVRCIHGLDDDVVPLSQSADYVADAVAAGGDAGLVEVDGDHFVVIDTGSGVWRRQLELLDELGGR